MTDEQSRDDFTGCPIGRFCSDLDRIFGKGSEFRAHLNRSRIELLKAIRALVDQGIDHLEKQNNDAADQKMTRIEVE